MDLFDNYKDNLEKVFGLDKDHRFYLRSLLFGKTIYLSLFDWIKEANTILER